MNTTVTATGMQVKATVPESLLISITSATEGFSDTVTLASDVATPNSTFTPTKDAISDTTVSFQKLTAEDLKHVNPNGTIATGYTPVFEATAKDHYHDTIWLSLTGADSSASPATNRQIVVSAAITDKEETASSDTIYKALHVGLVTGSGTMVEITGFTALGTATTSQNLVVLTYNAAATQIEVYCWLDGEDSNCYNGASLNADQYEINLTFAFAS